MAPRIKGGVHEALAHDSAHKHVTGEAIYVDNIPEPPGLLHAAFGQRTRPHARIVSVDLARVRATPGVVAVIAAADVLGIDDAMARQSFVLPPYRMQRGDAGAYYLVMIHSHPLDLAICEHVLRRGDFAYLGPIGSKTKRRRFDEQLRNRGTA